MVSVLTLFVLGGTLFAQDDYEGTKSYYTSEIYGGIAAHTSGWGLNLVKAKRITGFKKVLFSAEIVGMKHHKEDKRLNAIEDNSKRYVFGKMNSLTIIRPAIGRQKVLYTKETKRGVQIGWNYLFGASLGLVKPVYLEIARPSILSKPENIPTSMEAYNKDEHTPDMIVGRAPIYRGIEEARIYPGVHAKFGLNFEYASDDALIRSVETGISFDGYLKKVPIMAFTSNNRFFVAGYVSFQIGKKSLD